MNPLALALFLLSIPAASSTAETHAVEALGSGAPPNPLTEVEAAAAAGHPPNTTAVVDQRDRGCGHAEPRHQHRQKHPSCAHGPAACEAASPRHACCFRRFCRDLSADPLNCGACGRKCKHGTSCCGGSCARTQSDRRHCGGCGRACRRHESCAFGMCGYG